MEPVTPWYLTDFKKQYSAKEEQRLLSKVEAVVSAQQAERQSHRDTRHVHPSDLSKNDWCPRATTYGIMGTVEKDQESLGLRRLNIFEEGNAIHRKWQNWMWQTGCLEGNWFCNTCENGWMGVSPAYCPNPKCGSRDIRYREVPIHSDEHMLIGHADGMWADTQGRAVVEIKSVGLGTIRWDAPDLYAGYESGDLKLDDLWKKIKRPLLPHRRQVNLYMHCLKVDKAIVIYEWKPSQEIKEFHLSYDAALVKPMLDGALQVKEAVEAQVLPPRPVGFYKSKQCKWCSYRNTCWAPTP